MAAITIAADRGAIVIATTRNPDKSEALRAAGAHHVVIDGGTIAEEVREIVPAGVDAGVELVGRLETIQDSLLTIRPRGVLSLVGFLGDEWDYALSWPPSTVRLTLYSSDTFATAITTPVLQTIVDKVTAGTYGANIHQTVDFTDVAEAHTMMEANLATGKLVVVTP
jgi:NADPH:quinone reductase-like Zn-dependent oxidoreductase